MPCSRSSPAGCRSSHSDRTRSSGRPVRDAAEAARVAASVLAFGRTGVVIANPVPASDAMESAVVERLVAQAERRALLVDNARAAAEVARHLAVARPRDTHDGPGGPGRGD